MRPILFEVSGLQIASYGVCMVLGAVLAWFFARLLASRDKESPVHDAWNMAYVYLIGLCGAFTGAFLFRPITRLPELIINSQDFAGVPIGSVMGYLFGEIVFYGGFIGAVLAVLFYCRACHISVLPVLDIFAPAIALGHAVGRVGCFLGGCCYGVHVDPSHPFAVIFPENTVGGAPPPGEPLLAVQLIEAACLLVIAAVLAAVFIFTAVRGSKKQGGLTVCMYGLLYGAARFVLEFFRGDIIRGVYGPFSTSQYISVVIFCTGIGMLVYLVRNVTKMSQNREGQCIDF